MAITDDFDDATDGNSLDTLARWEHLYDQGAGGTSDAVETSTDGGGLNVELVQYGYDGGHATGFWTRTEAAGFPDDQYAQFTKDNNLVGAGPAIRCDAAGDGYGAACGGGLLATIRFDAGIGTVLSSAFPTTNTGDTIRIAATGTTISRSHNGGAASNITDATHTSGVVGLWTNGGGAGNGCLLDNFESSDAAASGPVEGTVALAYGGTVAAAGQATRLGTAALDYGGTVTATGTIPTVVVEGAAVAAYGGTATAVGTRRVLGSGSASYGGTVTAAGAPVGTGTVDLDYGGVLSGAGTVTRFGTAVLAYGGTVTATGTIPTDNVTGTAALDYGGSVTASGLVARSGAATVAYGGQVTAAGQVTRLGAAVVAYGGTVTASGVIPTGAVLGTAVAAYGGSVTGSGQVTRTATGAAGYGGQVVVDAVAVRLGTVVLDYAGAVTATGTIPVDQGTGTAALDYGGVVAGSGQTRRAGAAVLAYGGGAAALGTVTRLATAVAAYGGVVVVLVDPEGTHPAVRDSSARVVSTVMATPDGLTVIVLRDGSTVRRYEHPGWVAWTGDPNTLIEI